MQIVDDPREHVPVPETNYTFDSLIKAQAIGDLGALKLEFEELILEEVEVAVVPVEDGLDVGWHQVAAGAVLELRVQPDEHRSEVVPVRGRIGQGDLPGERSPPRARRRRKPQH